MCRVLDRKSFWLENQIKNAIAIVFGLWWGFVVASFHVLELLVSGGLLKMKTC